MLGMSAHINYDLAIATDLSGYSANPSKYKTDYDRINDVLQDALPPVATALSTYYGTKKRQESKLITFFRLAFYTWRNQWPC